MSILYASILATKDKLKLAESSNFARFKMQIKSLLPSIEKGVISDSIEYDDNYLTYVRLKELIILCISPKRYGTEKPSLFLETLINRISNIYGGIKQLCERITKAELCLQEQLGPQIESIIKEFDTGRDRIQGISDDVEEIKGDLKNTYKQVVNNVGTLDQALLNAEKLKDNAGVYKKNANTLKKKTACCGSSPCVIKLTIAIVVIVALVAAYFIMAFIHCNSINIFCKENIQ
jgi:hypothetical protein